MTAEELAFWERAYLTVLALPDTNAPTAKAYADMAVRHRRDAKCPEPEKKS